MNINDIVSGIVALIFLIAGIYFNHQFNQIGKNNDLSSVKDKR